MKRSLYYNDHPPPHFHAQYAGATMEVTISPIGRLRGGLPATQAAQVLAWAHKRQADLLTNWQLARTGQPLRQIAP
jgi:hypothetical protein